MRLTSAALAFSLAGAVSPGLAGQAAAEQDFHPIWCPQATSYYVQAREALDPLRAATIAHELDVAKARRQANAPKQNSVPPVNQHYNEDQPPYTADGNPLQPRHPSPPVQPTPAPQSNAAEQQAPPASPAVPAPPAPEKKWGWGDQDVQDAVEQFEDKAPLIFRRINTLAAMTWWSELQDAESELSVRFGAIVGDERDQVSAADLTKDWIALEEQDDVVKNLCVGWGETAVPGQAPPGQPEWPTGASPQTARPPGVENTAWPHSPGWEDLPEDAPTAPRTEAPIDPDAATKPLTHQGCERYDFRSGGWGQYPNCPGEGPDAAAPGDDAAPGGGDQPDGQGD